MKRIVLLFLVASSICLGMGNRPIFVKVYQAWKDSGYTLQQVADATDQQVITHAGLDPNEVIQWNKWKRAIRPLAKAKLAERDRLAREETITLPALTQIVQALKASGNLTTAEATAEMLQTMRDQQ